MTEEAAHAKAGQRPMTVTISRLAAKVLQAEAVRRVERGSYPTAEALVVEALQRAYSG